MIWHAVRNADGVVVSIGTVISDDLAERGFTVDSVEVGDGECASIVDGRLVAVPIPERTPERSLEELVAEKVADELDRRGVTADALRSR